jgi:hypothetical protein
MPSAETDTPRSPLCSELSARRGLPLIGTAGFYETVLAFELPSPWAPKLAGSRAGDAALDAAIKDVGRDKRVRLLAIENDETTHERSRILCFRRGPGPFERYTRSETSVARAQLAATLRELPFAADGADEDPTLRDVLVCTHGARDACCGKFGFPLYRRFGQLAAGTTDLRVWRTSHLGGHRFAPTLLDLPSGRLYGRVTHDDAGVILRGGAELAGSVDRIYRGRCALPEAAQIVERALWSREGEGMERAAFEVRSAFAGDGSCEVRLEARSGGRVVAVEAIVERSAAAAVETPASCGRDPEVEAPWTLRSLRAA